MAILPSELDLIRFELGFNTLTTGAEPYIGIAAVFSQVIQPYLRSGLITTSTTSVTAASTPTLVTLTLAAVTGVNTQGTAVSIVAGDRFVIDVDASQESATVHSVSGLTVSVALSLAHSGTYSVTVESGEAILRGILRQCRAVTMKLESASGSAGIKKVDEIEFFASTTGGSTVFADLIAQQQYWRDQLRRVLFGVGEEGGLLSGSSGAGTHLLSVY